MDSIATTDCTPAVPSYRASLSVEPDGFKVTWRDPAPHAVVLPGREAAETLVHELNATWRRDAEQIRSLPPEDLLVLARSAQMQRDTGISWDQENPDKIGTPVGEIVTKFLAERSPQWGSRRTHATANFHLTRFVNTFGKRILGSITPEELDKFVTTRGRAPHYFLTAQRWVAAIFNWAFRNGYLPHERRLAIHSMKPIKAGISDPEIWTPKELRKMLTVSSVDELPRLVVAAFAGVRTAEIDRMRWANWNSHSQCIILSSDITKTSRRRVVDAEPVLTAWMELLSPLRKPDAYLAKRISFYNSTQKQMLRQAVGDLKANAFRHSYASYHLALHNDVAKTSRYCGHSQDILQTVYYQAVTKDAARAWFGCFPNADDRQRVAVTLATPRRRHSFKPFTLGIPDICKPIKIS